MRDYVNFSGRNQFLDEGRATPKIIDRLLKDGSSGEAQIVAARSGNRDRTGTRPNWNLPSCALVECSSDYSLP